MLQKKLKELQHLSSPKPVNGPTPCTAPIYSKSFQYSPIEEEKTLKYKRIWHVQVVCGKLLYPERPDDNTMMHALKQVFTATPKGTKLTAK